MKNLLLLLLLLPAFPGFSQIFTGGGGPIADDGTHSYFPLTVSGLPATIDAGFGLETVCIDLTHTWNDDLIISLISPDGTEFELSSRNGGDSDNYTNTCFNYGAQNPIYNAWGPFSGLFKPEGFMSMINNGQDPNGVWTLHLYDVYAFADTGELLEWSIEFGNDPATPFPFSHARLPLVVVSTDGFVIPNEPKIMAQMKIVDNGPGQFNFPDDPATGFEGWIGVEVRGHSSSNQPKKSYAFETRDADSSGLDVSLLGMPEEEDWVLLGNYSDKTLLRNYYSYHLFRKMGRWAPRMEFCELVIDGEYQGIYLLGELIRRGEDRLDISSLSAEDTLGTELTGGYIFKMDWEDAGDLGWSSDFPALNATWPMRYLFYYPNPEDVHPAQLEYLSAYVDSFEYAMNSPDFADPELGYRQFADEASFIDYIILSEFTKNVDGYRLSTYLHKDKEGKIHAGPPWDYDLSWGNADYMEGWLPSGWDYQIQGTYTNQCAFWWQKFFEDTTFQNNLKCRWNELRENELSPGTIKAEIDSLAARLSVSTGLNFTKWPILGIYVWPNPQPIPQTYPGEIAKIKTWVDQRIAWLDSHWPGECLVNTAQAVPAIPEFRVSVFPNPSKGSFQIAISGAEAEGTVEIADVAGRLVYRSELFSSPETIQLDVPSGIYLLSFRNALGIRTERIVVE